MCPRTPRHRARRSYARRSWWPRRSSPLSAAASHRRQRPTPRQVVSHAGAHPCFVPITPERVLDTRGPANGPIGVPIAAKLGADQTIDIDVAGVGTIP